MILGSETAQKNLNQIKRTIKKIERLKTEDRTRIGDLRI